MRLTQYDRFIGVIVWALGYISIPALCNDLARGFNENIDWVALEEGQKQAAESNKPLMVLIHKSWCGACKALKSQFGPSKEIEELSKKFVMVNLEDEEEPGDKKFSPDGGYIPRILFFDTTGEIRKDIYNEAGNPNYKFYYPKADDVVSGMKNALKKLTNIDEDATARAATDEL